MTVRKTQTTLPPQLILENIIYAFLEQRQTPVNNPASLDANQYLTHRRASTPSSDATPVCYPN